MNEQDTKKDIRKYLILFLTVLIGVVITFLVVISRSNNQFIKSRTELVSALNNHISSAQEHLVSSQNLYASHQTHVIDGLYSIIDSLSRQSIKSQKQMVSALRECMDELKALNSAVNNSELRAEFDILKSDIEVSMEYINSHVQLHIDKMNNTVSTFELWAAILTIIFLVFSFYSLYKVDELVRQGREGVDYIDQLKTKADDSVQAFNEKSELALKNMSGDLRKLVDEQTSLILQNYGIMDNQLGERIDQAIKLSEKAITDYAQYGRLVEKEKEHIYRISKELDEKFKEQLEKLEKISSSKQATTSKETHG